MFWMAQYKRFYRTYTFSFRKNSFHNKIFLRVSSRLKKSVFYFFLLAKYSVAKNLVPQIATIASNREKIFQHGSLARGKSKISLLKFLK